MQQVLPCLHIIGSAIALTPMLALMLASLKLTGKVLLDELSCSSGLSSSRLLQWGILKVNWYTYKGSISTTVHLSPMLMGFNS